MSDSVIQGPNFHTPTGAPAAVGVVAYLVGNTETPVSSASALPTLDAFSAREARPPATDALYSSAGTGVATALASGATYVELTATGSPLWFRFGGNSVSAAAPSASVTTGASRYLAQGSTILIDVHTASFFAVASTGGFVLAWWTS